MVREGSIDPVNNDMLRDMIAAQMPIDCFGPETDQPYLLIDLSGTDSQHSSWLRMLPCPIIGIGKGALGEACDVVLGNSHALDGILRNIEKAPIAAMILVQHLRASEALNMQDALTAESFAYATAQKGPEFLNWLADYKPTSPQLEPPEQPLETSISDNCMKLVLNDPGNLNAIGVKMRDCLCEALDLALADETISKIMLSGAERTFSTGGKVDEFGAISDPATAHWVRSLRLPATRLAQLKDRLHIHVNGAAIGAGAEIAAFGKTVSASPDAWFQLPELKYGLIPGAGGTVSLPRRIGRQRTAYLALSMQKINAQTALDWGLVDELQS